MPQDGSPVVIKVTVTVSESAAANARGEGFMLMLRNATPVSDLGFEHRTVDDISGMTDEWTGPQRRFLGFDADECLEGCVRTYTWTAVVTRDPERTEPLALFAQAEISYEAFNSEIVFPPSDDDLAVTVELISQ